MELCLAKRLWRHGSHPPLFLQYRSTIGLYPPRPPSSDTVNIISLFKTRIFRRLLPATSPRVWGQAAYLFCCR
ncbi:hypothetical protein KCP69_02715 [Salmonella enterica subsp. enterica]|nr:hypothetical protein KCP69_02715 [Salmonella enterica subsp. enterica]